MFDPLAASPVSVPWLRRYLRESEELRREKARRELDIDNLIHEFGDRLRSPTEDARARLARWLEHFDVQAIQSALRAICPPPDPKTSNYAHHES